jgi:uncharacterized protein
MKIVIIGATGMIGQRILGEALERGHQVTAVAHDCSMLPTTQPNLTLHSCDTNDAAMIKFFASGHDVMISAVNVDTESPQKFVEYARELIEGIRQMPATRLITVGYAGSLEIEPGLHWSDTPELPDEWKPAAQAHEDALDIYRAAPAVVNWTCFSPAALCEPGNRTGKYRRGGNQLVLDRTGRSRISAEDFAVALLDEVENPRAIRQRFTAAY